MLPTTTTSYESTPPSTAALMLEEPSTGLTTTTTSFVMEDWREYVMLTSVTFNGMSAGMMMFIFSNTIMPALGKLSDQAGITAMITINDVILNPFFKLLFVGGLVSVVPTVEMFWKDRNTATSSKPQRAAARYYALASTLIYFLGQIVVTATQNIPRNNVLMSLDVSSEAASEYWRNEYLTKWVAWNTSRCVFSTLATILGAMALRFLGKHNQKQ